MYRNIRHLLQTTLPESENSIFRLALALVCFSLVLKVGVIGWMRIALNDPETTYSYVGSDYPERWPIDIPPILMASDASHRFQLDAPDGIAEWSAIIPGSGLIYLGPEQQPYTISMLHQLRCLDIVRAEMVRDRHNGAEETTELGRHCLNYLKQMVLCRGDLQLEPFLWPSHINPIDAYATYECRDWGAVYAEVQRNQEEYSRWLETADNGLQS